MYCDLNQLIHEEHPYKKDIIVDSTTYILPSSPKYINILFLILKMFASQRLCLLSVQIVDICITCTSNTKSGPVARFVISR